MPSKMLLRPLKRRLASSLPGQIVKYGWDGRLDHKGFPRWVHIENTNHCPARCSMCSMDQMQRPTGMMDVGLFQKIVDECSHYRQVEQIHLHGFGEPLLDKQLHEKVRYVKERSRAFTYIVTTINIMTEDFAREIIGAGLDGMKISLYGDTKQTYEAIHRRLKFERTLAAMDMFLKVRDEMKAPNPALRVQFAEGLAPTAELESWARRWGPKLDADRGDVLLKSTMHNWVGAKPTGTHQSPESERYCSWPFHDIQILWDGRVAPCVFDFDGTVALGNIKHQTVREVWRSQAYEAFRNAWRTRTSYSIPICRACDAPDGRFEQVRLPRDYQPQSRNVVRTAK